MLIYFIFLLPIFNKLNITPVLNGHLWWLFVIDTMLIAAGSYVVNDIFDQSTDKHNKPNKSTLINQSISNNLAWYIYITITIIGLDIAIYIGFMIDKLPLIIIFPCAVGLLYYYSKSWKRKPFIGNFIVATFCAFVPAIIWYAEYDNIKLIKNISLKEYNWVVNIFTAYISFGFLTTIIREIIKDIEDINGDQLSGYITLPIAIGVKKSKYLALIFSLLLLSSYVLWLKGCNGIELLILIALLGICFVIPTFFIIYKITKAKVTQDYSKISKYLKYIMIMSLIVFLCIPYLKK